jgi:proline iminopeptidase
MTGLYSQSEPYNQGMLDVGDGHQVFWETCGNPDGKPALVLHGGPGSGCTPVWRRYFDLNAYRVVLFDQRGCGRSTPHASAPLIDLSANTTDHLIADIEVLRRMLGIDRWLVLGGSWGSTLALVYAERHPDRVSELVLFSVTTTAAWEIDWITNGVSIFFPDAWARLRAGVPEARRTANLLEDYNRLLLDSDPAIHEKAARDWCDWEIAIVSTRSDVKPAPRYDSGTFRLAFARIVTHFWSHRAWLQDEELLTSASRLSSIPGVMVHGRLDVSSPIITAWRLKKRWRDSELIVVDDAGHGGVGMEEIIVEATNRLSSRR